MRMKSMVFSTAWTPRMIPDQLLTARCASLPHLISSTQTPSPAPQGLVVAVRAVLSAPPPPPRPLKRSSANTHQPTAVDMPPPSFTHSHFHALTAAAATRRGHGTPARPHREVHERGDWLSGGAGQPPLDGGPLPLPGQLPSSGHDLQAFEHESGLRGL